MSERSNVKVLILSSVATVLICISTAAALYFWNENRRLKALILGPDHSTSASKDTESMKRACRNQLQMIELAAMQWALEKRKSSTEPVFPSDLTPYIPRGWPQCPAGGKYQLGTADTQPTCSHHGNLLAQ